MKTICKNIAMAALVLSAVACSQNDDFSPSYLNDPDAVRITVQVGNDDATGGFTRSNPLGTPEEQTKFNSGDQISVTAGSQTTVVYQLGENGWNPVGDTYLKWQTDEMDVTAYYPVDKNNASATTFTVPTEYSETCSIADADYMTYDGKQTKGDDKSINLTMQRKMVRVVIDEITFNDQFAEDYSVTGIKVHANTKGYADGKAEEGSITVTALQQDNAFYALLAPTTEDGTATFMTVTVSDGTTSQVLTVKGIPATAAGNSYSFSLTVGKDKASIKEPTVTDWSTGSVIDTTQDEVKEQMLYTYENGTYQVYMVEGLEAAIEAAGATASTIKLMDVLTITREVEIGEDANITLDLNNSTLTGNYDKAVYSLGSLTIDNCVIKSGGNSNGVYSYGSNSELTIGENVKVENANYAIWASGKKCTINGGNMSGKRALYCSDGEVIVNGGTFTATSDSGYAIFCTGADNVTINGGTFTGAIGSSNVETIIIKGGTFSVDPSEYVDTENYTITSNENGTYTVTEK